MSKLQFAIAGILVTVILMLLSAGGGYLYGKSVEREAAAAAVADLQAAISRLGQTIQKEAGQGAANAAKAKQVERDKQHAINVLTERSRKTIERLQQQLVQARDDLAKAGSEVDPGHYIVIDGAEFDRVWNEARTSTNLPASDSPSVIQKRLPATSAADYNEAIRYAIERYNRCAIDYNQLWRTSDTMITKAVDACAKKSTE